MSWAASRYCLDEALQIMPDGNLAHFAALVEESKAILVAGVEKITSTEVGHRADPGGRVDQDRDDRPVTKAHHVAQVDTR